MNASSITLARVVDTHPEDHSVDLVMLDDGSRWSSVQVLAPPGASTNTGISGLVQPAGSASDKWTLSDTQDRDIIAACAWYREQPVVVGFLFPQVNQILFDKKNFRVNRHASDVYSTVDDDGNLEVYHPSGTFFRVGTSGAHVDLTGTDFDKKWKIGRNTGKAVNVRLEVHNAGASKMTLNIAPNGDIAITTQGKIDVTSTGNVTVTAPVSHFEGDVTVSGDVTAGTISLRHHVHSGITPGGSNTAQPVP